MDLKHLGQEASVPGPPAHAPWHRLSGSESDGHQTLACLMVVMQEACPPPKPLASSPCLRPIASQHQADSPRAVQNGLSSHCSWKVRARLKEPSEDKNCDS